MVHFAKCCCCIELRTGAIILGVLTLIVSIWNLVGSFTGYAYYFNDEDFMSSIVNDEFTMAILKVLRVYYIWTMIISICMIVASSLMIFGAVKRRRKFMIPYLACEIVRTIVDLIYLIYSFTLLSDATNSAVQTGAAAIVGAFIGLAISIYLWLCVYSLFQLYRDEESRRGMVGGAAPQPGFHPAYTGSSAPTYQ